MKKAQPFMKNELGLQFVDFVSVEVVAWNLPCLENSGNHSYPPDRPWAPIRD